MRRRYHHFSIRSILSFFLGVVGCLKVGRARSFFAKKVHKKTSFISLFLTTQKSSHHVVVRREKRRETLSLSLSECVCVLLSRLTGFLRRQQRALIIVVVLFESEESSFFCRSSEENRSHLLWERKREKKDFRLGKHVLLPSSRQSGEDFVDRIRREGGLWRHVFQV